MLRSTILAALWGASITFAVPTWPQANWGSDETAGHDAVSDYFNLLAKKVNASKHLFQAPACDLAKALMPTGATPPLPAAEKDLVLAHVAIGRGTQNYTCDVTKPNAAPAQIGALATLFNVSCIASLYPDLLQALPKLALQFELPSAGFANRRIGPTNLLVSGEHYFTNATTPFFNLDLGRQHLGEAPCTKLNGSDAPADAPKGPDGSHAVQWLRLGADPGATGGLREVYRLETAGGAAPSTCQGMPASFEVQYAAQYWFYRKP